MKIINFYKEILRGKPKSLQIVIKLQTLVVAALVVSSLARMYARYLEFQLLHISDSAKYLEPQSHLWSGISALTIAIGTAILAIIYEFFIRIVLVKEKLSWVRYFFCIMTIQLVIGKFASRVNVDTLKKMVNTPEFSKCTDMLASYFNKLENRSAITIWTDMIGVIISLLTLYFFFRPDVTLWLKQKNIES